ncbi:hypothetical protein GFS60_06745 (plasmid) [Rhodococcus sp. WAY2]|nr:hypothetical protein GFS60_06745 [Rhodococcus sp. WAY2]
MAAWLISNAVAESHGEWRAGGGSATVVRLAHLRRDPDRSGCPD